MMKRTYRKEGIMKLVKIVKNIAVVSSILSSTISVLVAARSAVINSPENANKRDKGSAAEGEDDGGARSPVFACIRHIRGEFLPCGSTR